MRRMRDPQQIRLFDPFQGVLSDMARKRIAHGWQGLVRTVVLKMLPVSTLAEHFSPDNGCPTKELYSMAGLVFLADFFGWNALEAADAYMMRTDVQFALNIEPGVSCCDRTVERYQALFSENNSAAKVFADVTDMLVKLLELDVSQQRLDSTHVYSHMATFGRVKLMAVTLKRCLTQIKRHAIAEYQSLPEDLQSRYTPAEGKLFADAKDAEARTRSRLQVAQDMLVVIEKFADHSDIKTRPSYTTLVSVFYQQCEVVGEDRVVVVKTKTGGDVIQNPSDLDASYDGHKGQGYQIQLSETCSPENDVQLILGALPETASAADGEAVKPMLEELQSRGVLPEVMLADTAYGGDDNVQFAASLEVELIAPVPGRAPQFEPDQLTIDDFAHNEVTGSVDACPASQTPLRVTYDAETEMTCVEMPAASCESCPLRHLCPIVKLKDGTFQLEFTDKQARLAARRAEERTPVFREHYSMRSGIESTNSGLKNRLGLGWLSVRGQTAVSRKLLHKVTGWNVLRAASSETIRAMVGAMIAKLYGAEWSGLSGQVFAVVSRDRDRQWSSFRQSRPLQRPAPSKFRTNLNTAS